MNSARSVLLATIPPTFAAARKTTCGRFAANQPETPAWSRKSSSRCATVSSSTPSRASRRTNAAPTIPRWPATKTDLPFRSNGIFAIGNLPPGGRKIARHHFLDELREARLRLPAELLARLAGIADQEVDFGRTEIRRIDANDRFAGLPVDAGFRHALAAPRDASADFCESQLDEFTHRASLPGCQHEIARLIRLQYPIHALHIVPSMAPITFCLEVAEIKRVFQAGLDTGDRAGDLARHERFAANRAFMIEQDTIRSEHAVRLSVVHRYPITVKLRDPIRRTRIEGRGFLLREFLSQPVQLRGRRLVESGLLLHAEYPDRFQ